MIGAENLEAMLRGSNLIYKKAWQQGYEAGRREAYAEFKRIIEQAEKMALLNKQAG